MKNGLPILPVSFGVYCGRSGSNPNWCNLPSHGLRLGGVRRKKGLWSQAGRSQLESFPLKPWASRRREDLLELLDQLTHSIVVLTAAVEQQAGQHPEAMLSISQPIGTKSIIVDLAASTHFDRICLECADVSGCISHQI
jgi:hypothetical protein